MPRDLASMMRFSILVAHAQTVAATDAVGFEEEFDGVGVFFAVQCNGHAFFKAYTDFFGFDFDVFVPKGNAHDGFDDFDAAVEEFQVFGFVGGTQHVGVGRVGFFNRHFVVEAVGNQKFAHFVTAAEFVDKLLVEPRFVDFQRRIGQEAVTVETLDVVAFVGAAVAPDIHIVFFHGGNEHGAGNGAAQRRGVEVGDAAGGNVERAALDGGDAFMCQLRAAVNQAGVSAPYSIAFLGMAL